MPPDGPVPTTDDSPKVVGFRVLHPLNDGQRVRLMAQQIQDQAQFERILADVEDPAMRAEVRMLLEPMLTFGLAPENADGD